MVRPREKDSLARHWKTSGSEERLEWLWDLDPFCPSTHIKLKLCQRKIHSANIVRERSMQWPHKEGQTLLQPHASRKAGTDDSTLPCAASVTVTFIWNGPFIPTSCWRSTLIQVPGLRFGLNSFDLPFGITNTSNETHEHHITQIFSNILSALFKKKKH
jgi:hypothetical protein